MINCFGNRVSQDIHDKNEKGGEDFIALNQEGELVEQNSNNFQNDNTMDTSENLQMAQPVQQIAPESGGSDITRPRTGIQNKIVKPK